jgi:hypothetical protein
VRPFFLLESLKNNAFSFLSTWLRFRGPNTCTAGYGGGAATLLDAALRSLEADRLDLALFVAAARPTSALARLERERRGLAESDGPPGDAAAAILLGNRASARAHVLGRAFATDAPGGPEGAALRRVVADALAEAEAPAEEVAVVFGPARLRGRLEGSLPPAVAWVDAAVAVGDTALARSGVDLALATEALHAQRLARAAEAPIDLRGRVALVLEAGWLGQTAAFALCGPGRRRT